MAENENTSCFTYKVEMILQADSLDQNSPALKDVITPDEPAHAKVMAVSPIDQTLKINKRITKRFKKIFRKYF